ncbi:MAG: HNH endonuclease [Deltaproteobacteria bacterium]|nr:HNH endonuclease [Deltaproteobacteria bacterium]
MSDHRTLPMPPSFEVPPTTGICRWCGKPVHEPRRWRWHSACLKIYEDLLLELSQPNYHLLERQNGCCAGCGYPLVVMTRYRHWWPVKWIYCWREEELPWQDDHIIALVDALPHADDPWWQWRLSNRQALCPPCHRAKTAAENTRRAAWRKAWKDQVAEQGKLFGEEGKP